MSPENFFGYVFGDRIKEASVLEVKSILDNIFETLEKDAHIVNSEIFDPNNLLVECSKERQSINKFANSHSLYKPYVDNRLVQNIYKTASAKPTERSTDPLTLELAKQYVNYKVAALNYISDLGKLNENLLFTAVFQNRA